MTEKERVINVRHFLWFLLDKLLLLIVVAVLCSGVVAGINYRQQKKTIAEQKNEKIQSSDSSLDRIISQNRTSFYNNANNYTDNIKPDGTYNSYARLFVDIDYSTIENLENLNIVQINDEFGLDVCNLAVSEITLNPIIDKLNLNADPDMEDLSSIDLMWMINKNFVGGHILNLAVTDTNAKRAQNILKALTEQLIKNMYEYLDVKEVRVISEATLPENSMQEEVITRVDKEEFVKMGFIGMFAGLVLAVLILLICFLNKDAVYSGKDLEFVELNLINSIPIKARRKDAAIKKLAVKLAAISERTIMVEAIDKYPELSGIMQTMTAYMSKIGTNTILLSASEYCEQKDNLDQNTKIVVYEDNYAENVACVESAVLCDKVILWVISGKTKMRDIIDARRELMIPGKKVEDVVLDQLKH